MARQTTWNFKLFYQSDKDPQIERDLSQVERALQSFGKKYKGRDFTSTVDRLLKALKDYEKLEEAVEGFKPWFYFSRRKDVDAENASVAALETQIESRMTAALNKVAFFRLELGKVSASRQTAYLKDKKLKNFHYFLKLIFERARYNLTEPEEQLAALLSQPAYSMWVDGQSKLLSAQTIPFGKKSIPISEAVSILADQPKVVRDKLHRAINERLKNVSHFAEAEINAVYNFKKIIDERRGYAEPYTATVLGHEMDGKTVEELVKVVTQNFRISRRFYKLHAKLLKQKRLTLADRNAPIGKIKKKFDFRSAASLVKDAFVHIDPQYSATLMRYIKDGQLDIFPRKGKRGGAYCASNGLLPVLIMLNHTDDIRSLETLAHEMGHAFHYEASKHQAPLYRVYSTAVAEVASTFFEQAAAAALEEKLSPRERIILLHNKIKSDIMTIFAQIALFNFELALHKRIRREGQLSKEEIAKLMSEHLRSYMGEICDVTDDDGYFFVRLAHIRWHFYVYSYAFGQLVSRALFEKWKEDKSYAKKIAQFLSAGGSMSPKDIFKSIGVDTTDPKFFLSGLKAIEKDIDRLERLVG